jgi:hypothetical protein
MNNNRDVPIDMYMYIGNRVYEQCITHIMVGMLFCWSYSFSFIHSFIYLFIYLFIYQNIDMTSHDATNMIGRRIYCM